MKRPFDQALILGQIGENTASWYLRKIGFNVERNCDGLIINRRGPSMQVPGQAQIPRPDLAISKRGVVIPAEVKTKSDRTLGRLTNEWETGFDHRRWIDYLDYERATGLRVLMIFVEYTWPGLASYLLRDPRLITEVEETGRTTKKAEPDAILAQWLQDLAPSLGGQPTLCEGREMIYFAIAQFRQKDWLALPEEYVSAHALTLI